MARLYANENFPFPVVEELRRLGHNVLPFKKPEKANKRCPMKKFSLRPSKIKGQC